MFCFTMTCRARVEHSVGQCVLSVNRLVLTELVISSPFRLLLCPPFALTGYFHKPLNYYRQEHRMRVSSKGSLY